MLIKNYWGEVQNCIVCNSIEIEEYFKYTPQFKNVIDSVFICGCEKHTNEAKEEYHKRLESKDRAEQGWSNS